MHPIVLAAILSVIGYVVYKTAFGTEQPRIKGLPEIPGVPIFGNLIQMGDHHALKCKEWAAKYGPVFQIRLGNKRVVVANSFRAVKELWIDNQVDSLGILWLADFRVLRFRDQCFILSTRSCHLAKVSRSEPRHGYGNQFLGYFALTSG
jgi:phenylacetate 2-hydroxylase